MDDLFLRINALEEENKSLLKRQKELDEQIREKEILQVKDYFLPKDTEKDIQAAKNYEQKKEEFKKLILANAKFPDKFTPRIEPIEIKGKLEDRDIISFLKTFSCRWKQLSEKKRIDMNTFESKISKEISVDNKITEILNEVETKYKGRIINYNNVDYVIITINKRDKDIKGIPLYDPNGIKVDIGLQQKKFLYKSIPFSSLFESSYIISKIESQDVLERHKKDNTNYLKIFYQVQVSNNPHEKEIIPYRINPNTIDINQYQIMVGDNLITTVINKVTDCIVKFKAVMIGETSQSSGLVSSSQIKVYTTLYSKDIINVLHVHINDTSERIAIDSEFIEKDENILNHKIFIKDAMGKRLTYKFIFRENKLEKIYYSMSDNYIDEPPFEEVRIKPNNIVKISSGQYKNYFGRVKQFPIGMLARKDKEKEDIKTSSCLMKEGESSCTDRHFAELPGTLSIEIIFNPGDEFVELEKPINIGIPACHLIPLNPQEEIKFQKSLIIHKESKRMEINNKVDLWYKESKEFENYLNDDKLLDNMGVEELKKIKEKVDNQNPEEFLKNNNEDNDIDALKFIQEIKSKMDSLLMIKIRLARLSNKN